MALPIIPTVARKKILLWIMGIISGILTGSAVLYTTLDPADQGTIKAEIVRINELYCSETNAGRRQVMIDTIRTYAPLWPQEGICGVRQYLYGALGLPEVVKPTAPAKE